jgi:hypothetical protein
MPGACLTARWPPPCWPRTRRGARTPWGTLDQPQQGASRHPQAQRGLAQAVLAALHGQQHPPQGVLAHPPGPELRQAQMYRPPALQPPGRRTRARQAPLALRETSAIRPLLAWMASPSAPWRFQQAAL